MYLLQGFLIGFLPVLAFAFIGLAIKKFQNSGTNIVIAIIVALVWGVIVWLVRWGSCSQIYGPTPLFGWLMVGFLIGSLIAAIGDDEFSFSAFAPGFLAFIVMGFWVIVVSFQSGAFINSTELGKVLSVETKHINQIDLELADPKHICLVDHDMAHLKAQQAMTQMKTSDNAIVSSRYDLGTATKQFVDSCLWWVFPLEFKGYWQWSSTATIPGYIRVSAEDPYADAQAVQFDKTGKEIAIRYLNSACFHQYAERYLREHGYARVVLDDFTFEVDDNWRPYYTVSNIEWTIGYNGDKVKSVVIFDLQSGDVKECPISDIPTKYPWLDRAIPQDILDQQCKNWGLYNRVEWTWTSSEDGKRQQPTEGWYLTYDKQKCYWITGWTSLNEKTSDLVGLSITNAQTGKSTYYPIQGFTEDVAQKVAKTLWAQFQTYEPTECVLYNVYGLMTYVMPMKDGNNFQGVSLVSMENKDIKSKGVTMQEALSNYRISMASVKGGQEIASSQSQTRQLKGIIEYVGMPTMQGTTQIFPFTIKDVKKIFSATYSFNNPKVPFMKTGAEVIITYADTKESLITVDGFDIPAIKISSENPNQASWVDNQKVVKAETNRVDNIQGNKALMENEDLSKINPDSLKNFIQKQKNK
jgi:hypothetical protein